VQEAGAAGETELGQMLVNCHPSSPTYPLYVDTFDVFCILQASHSTSVCHPPLIMPSSSSSSSSSSNSTSHTLSLLGLIFKLLQHPTQSILVPLLLPLLYLQFISKWRRSGAELGLSGSPRGGDDSGS